MSLNTVQQYITKWLKGDDLAYRRIFDYYYPKLFPICFRSVKQREDCEEMVMNVFLNIWNYRGNLLKVDHFESYLYKTLRNQISDFSRRNVLAMEDINTVAVEKLGSIDHPELSFKELELIYKLAVDRLPEKRREVFLMSRELGLSHLQIAKDKGISVNTVNNHIKSAMKIIRNDMGEYAEALPLITIIASSILS
ncbi:putative RNA polymerase sigma factor FecI [compost metagenome]